jgi:hypothetical protein
MTVLTKHRFASEAWTAELEQAMAAAFASAAPDTQGIHFSICEVYTGVPADLAPAGRLSWHCVFAGGGMLFQREELPTADLHITVDYETVLPVARIAVEGDAARQTEMERLIGAAIAAGKFTVRGDPSQNPAFLAGVHDRVAKVTA